MIVLLNLREIARRLSRFRQNGLRRADDQAAVLHALGPDQQVCKLAHTLRRTFYDNYFQACVVIEMCMRGRDDQIVMIMLHIHQSVRQ